MATKFKKFVYLVAGFSPYLKFFKQFCTLEELNSFSIKAKINNLGSRSLRALEIVSTNEKATKLYLSREHYFLRVFLLKSLIVQNNNDAETGVEVNCCETKTFLCENSVSTHKIF